MSSEYLPVFVGNALNENLEWIPDLVAGHADWRRILAFCQNFRIAGIGELLLTGLPGEFHLRLHQSGRAFADHLRRTAGQNQRTGQSLPFFDAIAAGDFEGALDIARHSKHSWTQGKEYEEDFLFVEFLMQYFFLDAPVDACERLIGRYEKALQGAEDIRLDLCKSLLTADSRGFGEAIERFLMERCTHYDELANKGGIAPEVLTTEGQLSVEGVALVRLAEQLGMETEEDYLQVPSVTREEPGVTFQAEAWKNI